MSHEPPFVFGLYYEYLEAILFMRNGNSCMLCGLSGKSRLQVLAA